MARFYSWSHDYINSLPCNIADEYWLAITAIEAREALVMKSVASAHALTVSGRKTLHDELTRDAYPVHLRKEISTEDLARKLMGG